MFDLRPTGQGVELIPFTAHPKTHPLGTQRPIHAYWLEYMSRHTRTVPLLNPQADYLFTPMLDGCYIGIGGTGIAHVAGDILSARRGVHIVRQAAAAALGITVGQLNIGFSSNLADAEQCTFVGIRRNGTWSWYVQGHGYFAPGRQVTLQPVFNGMPTVLQITNMTYG